MIGGTETMVFGVDYYPEHWDKKEWRKQAALMKEGGFNTVRMGEFAWKLFEPQEGVYDFDWLEEVIGILAEHEIKVVLGTPTAAPPKWLVNKYDVLLRDRYGRKREWGSRREYCANNPDYQEQSEKIVRKMAEFFKDNKNVIGWQIDNEFGCHGTTRCYCEHCRKQFGDWLKKKYGSIESLNDTWGTVFWGLDFDSFEDMILPGYNACEGETNPNPAHNPSLELEYRRFASESWVNYQQMQIDILREYTDKPVTHNLMGHFSDIDYYKLSEGLDFVSWDNYPRDQWGSPDEAWVAMAHEIMYGAKNKNFWVMEQQAGPCGWDRMGQTPRPGQLRLWTHQAVAHGAEGIVYFRFRTALFGMEQYWHGVLDHDGVPRRRFFELQQTGRELQSLSDGVIYGGKKQEVLLYRSFDDVWSHEIKSHRSGFHYEGILHAYYKANMRLGINTAVSNGRFEDYKVVYFPVHNVVTKQEAEEIKEYVANGGAAVFTFRSGLRDEFNNVRPLAVPGLFAELAGIEVTEFDTVQRNVTVTGEISGTAALWCDIIEAKEAEVVSTYSSEHYAGRAAITVNHYGKGSVYYVGCDLDDEGMKRLAAFLAEKHGVSVYDLPEGVERVEKEHAVYLLNHNETEKTVAESGISLLTGEKFSGLLPGYGVEVLARQG
ncbi:MAG: beta-galactosidase [Lachnospiraceae bacterium]|nr:beta-galactosidase [Lachnospiraceae bacterium]